MNTIFLTWVLTLTPCSGSPADLGAGTASLSLVAAVSQEVETLEDKRPVVAELIEKLDEHAGQRGKEDQEAIGVIEELSREFPVSGPRDRAAIVKALDKCFKEKRKEVDGVRENQLFMAAAAVLGSMAPESVDVLITWIGHKTHRADVPLQRVLIRMLGRTQSEDGVRTLTKLLNHSDALIQSAAASSLGEFEAADQELRKEIFSELLKLLMTVKGQKDSNPNDTIARDRWNVISAPVVSSLKLLSGHEEFRPEDWQRWYNKNRREDWDESE